VRPDACVAIEDAMNRRPMTIWTADIDA